MSNERIMLTKYTDQNLKECSCAYQSTVADGLSAAISICFHDATSEDGFTLMVSGPTEITVTTRNASFVFGIYP